jgi:hypothetical protein
MRNEYEQKDCIMKRFNIHTQYLIILTDFPYLVLMENCIYFYH